MKFSFRKSVFRAHLLRLRRESRSVLLTWKSLAKSSDQLQPSSSPQWLVRHGGPPWMVVGAAGRRNDTRNPEHRTAQGGIPPGALRTDIVTIFVQVHQSRRARSTENCPHIQQVLCFSRRPVPHQWPPFSVYGNTRPRGRWAFGQAAATMISMHQRLRFLPCRGIGQPPWQAIPHLGRRRSPGIIGIVVADGGEYDDPRPHPPSEFPLSR